MISKLTEQQRLSILESIVLEELALLQFVVAEAERIKIMADRLANGGVTPEETIDFQYSVAETMELLINKQILLHFDFQTSLEDICGEIQ